MARDERNASRAMTPGRHFRLYAFLFAFVQLLGLFFVSYADAVGDFVNFKRWALGLILLSSVLVVSGYMTTRRAWKGEPPADWVDGILPLVVILALGWGMWTLVHYSAAP